MAHNPPPQANNFLEKHPGFSAWVFGAIVLFGFIFALYLNAGTGHH